MNIKSLNTGSSTEYRVNQITIYGNGKTLYSREDHALKQQYIDCLGNLSDVYDGNVITLNLSTEPKRARKVNLDRKDNYIISAPGRYSWEPGGVHLFIHVSEIEVQPAGEHILFQSSGETNYCNAYTLKIKNGAKMLRRKVERVPDAGPGFIPPDGCKWSKNYSPNPDCPFYDVVSGRDEETRVIKRWIQPEIVFEMLVRGERTRTEKTPERIRREKIAEEINAARVFYREVSHYEIEKLLGLYDLTPKKDGETA